MYDFNTARHTRRDAKKSVAVNVYETAGSYTGDPLGTVKASVSLSDAISYPVSISFCQGNAVTNKLTLNAWDTGYSFGDSIPVKAWPWDANWGTCVIVRDQYNDVRTDVDVEFSVSNIVENSGEFAHLPKSFAVSQNNSQKAAISGVEIKDTFDLTATIASTGVNVKVPVTMGADYAAHIDSDGNENENTWYDETNKIQHTLRETLGYDR